jgi:hypothetical protein
MRPSRGQVIGTLGAVALLAALVAVGRLDAPGRPRRASAPASTTATPPTPPPTAGTTDTTVRPPTPPRLRGVPLAGTGGAALLIPEPSPSAVPGLFSLDSGRLTPIGGLPHGGCYLSPTRLPHGWALGRQAYQHAGQGCPETATRTQFYLLADGASSARGLPVTAEQILAGDTDSRLWLVTNLRPPDPNMGQMPQAVQQVDVSGHPHTPRYRIPDGYVAWQGMASGSLLLTLAEQGPADISLFALWNPRSGRVLRRYDRVLAATATTIAWVAAGCDPRRCPVHLSDLAVGTDTQVGTPRRAWANTGAFSPDGRYLAVVFGADVDASGAPTQARVWVVDTATRRLRAVPGAIMSAGDFWFGVTWSPDGAWLLLSAPADQHTDQLAAWRPGDTVLHVPRRQPPTGQHMAPAGG